MSPICPCSSSKLVIDNLKCSYEIKCPMCTILTPTNQKNLFTIDVSCLLFYVIARKFTLCPELFQGTSELLYIDSQIDCRDSADENHAERCPSAVAIDCEMVGGGSDGSLELCARVCLVDEDENLIFHAYVQPQIPVTNYRCLIFV